MAVHWTWKEKLGTIHCERQLPEEILKFDLTIYNGTNCLCAIVYEYEDNGKDVYNFWTFFNDVSHAKRVLGLAKDCDGEFKNLFEDEWKAVTFFGEYKEAWKLAELFFKAGMTVEIKRGI